MISRIGIVLEAAPTILYGKTVKVRKTTSTTCIHSIDRYSDTLMMYDVCCLCCARGCRRVPFETKLLTGGRGDVWLFNSALIHDSTRHISDASLRGVLLFKIRCVVARR